MENTELFAQVKAKINEAMQHAIDNAGVGIDILFLYTQLQTLERLEAMHETLKSIDGHVDAMSNMIAGETARF